MVIKAVPTREGIGFGMGNAKEISEAEIIEKKWQETNSRDGSIRRKALITDELIENELAYAVMVNNPTRLALSFCDHLDETITGVKTYKELMRSQAVKDLIARLEKKLHVPVTLFNTGKNFDCIIDLFNPQLEMSYPDLSIYCK
jgi:adenylosuccinate synthase